MPLPGTQLFIGNVPWEASKDEVRDLFSEKGISVRFVHLMIEPGTGRPMGYGFVTIGSNMEADDVIQRMSGCVLGGRALIVERSKGVKRPESRT